MSSMNAILNLFGDAKTAFIGPAGECHRLAALLNGKWDRVRTEVLDLFEDGLTYANHCANLYIQNDGEVCREMEELFTKTKLQGKTAKTIWKKEIYFRNGFSRIMTKHDSRLFAYERQENKGKPYDEQFRYDSSLSRWWNNYYFAEYEKELNYKPLALYPIFEEYAVTVRNAVIMDNRMKGNGTRPKLNLFKYSEAELRVEARGTSSLTFEWKEMNHGEVRSLVNTFEEYISPTFHSDWSKPLNKKIRKALPNCEVSFSEYYEDHHHCPWHEFYVCFSWKPEHFSWTQVMKAQRAVKKFVVPLIKHPFKPMEIV